MLSQEAIQKILGIDEKVLMHPEEMAKKLTITFYPFDPKKCSAQVLAFSDLLHKTLIELGVKVVSYDDALTTIPIHKSIARFCKIIANNVAYVFLQSLHRQHNYYFIHFATIKNLLNRRRIKKGISVIATGENETSKLPIDFTSSFTKSSVVTLLDTPKNIGRSSTFQEHFDTAMEAFARHMTQIVILVGKEEWILYNFNASHPIYPLGEDFKKNILHALVPKIVAPIQAHRFEDFIVEEEKFDVSSEPYKTLIEDFVKGGEAFNATKLYPEGKKIADLPWRNGFYRWIGKIHLDNRSGMSYGFLARQMPSKPTPMVAGHKKDDAVEDYFFDGKGDLFIKLALSTGEYSMKVPPVWVLSQRSGADKTHIDPKKDIVMLGLVNGRMYMRTPKGIRLSKDYRASFDTKVILAHAVGNAIVASILHHFDPQAEFPLHLEKDGLAIVHWHGYIRPDVIPEGWYYYGQSNPHVACSTPQSAIFALGGKLEAFEKAFSEKKAYRGDVHVEPHHGTNVTYGSIGELAGFLLKNRDASVLGNKYLGAY